MSLLPIEIVFFRFEWKAIDLWRRDTIEQYLLYAATIRRREKIYFGLSERKSFPGESEQSETKQEFRLGCSLEVDGMNALSVDNELFGLVHTRTVRGCDKEIGDGSLFYCFDYSPGCWNFDYQPR